MTPILFLDIDDVLCRCDAYGGADVIDVQRGKHPQPELVWAHVFAAEAKAAMTRLHAALDGRLRFVISSTWRLDLGRQQMLAVFRETGLGFVADGLEEGKRWRTPELLWGDRADEIARWLEHHHRGEPYAIVDDTFSGWTLLEAVDRQAPAFVDRVVCCEEGIGLRDEHVPLLLAALRMPGAR